jgi:hypothetical protein
MFSLKRKENEIFEGSKNNIQYICEKKLKIWWLHFCEQKREKAQSYNLLTPKYIEKFQKLMMLQNT